MSTGAATGILGWLLFCVMVAIAIDREEDAKQMALIDPTPAAAPCGVTPKPKVYQPWQVVPKGTPDHRSVA